MLAEIEQTGIEIGSTVIHSAHGRGLVQRVIGPDRAFVKFVAPTEDGDVEDVVLLEDLQLVQSRQITLEDRAALSLKYKIPGIPLGVRSKAPVGIGAKEATLDPLRIAEFLRTQNKESNWGLVAQSREGGVWILDCDSPEVAKLFKKETGKSMPTTLTVQSSQGGHRYFRQNAKSLTRLKNFSVSTPEGKEFFSVRWDSQYTVGPLSIHEKTGKVYKIVCDVVPAEAPDFLIDWLLAQHKQEAPKQKALAEPDGGVIPNGLRDITLTSIAGKQRNAGSNEEDIYQVLSRINAERCEIPLPDDQVRKIARSIGAKPDGTTLPSTVTIGGVEPGLGVQATLQTTSPRSVAEILDALPKESKLVSARIEDMPSGVLIGRLGEACQEHMRSFPLAYSWLSLVVHAGLFVPQNSLSALRTNLYFAPVGPPHDGKSMASTYAQGLLGIEKNNLPLVDVMSGSAEGLIKMIGDSKGEARLVNPDELGFLLERSSLDGASFPYVLNRAFYDTMFSLTTSGGKMVPFNCRLSLIGGISISSEGDYEAFGDLYGPKTVGGLYDRSLFGLKPSGFEYEFIPFCGGPAAVAMGLANLKAPSVTQDVWEAKNHWVKQYGLNPRTTESAIRVAGICAAYDGVALLRPQDIEKSVIALSEYETRLQLILKPNTGKNDDGVLANKFLNYLRRNGPNGEWLSERDMLRNTHAYDLGTRSDRVLASLEYNGEIERGSSLVKGGRKRLVRIDVRHLPEVSNAKSQN